VFKFISFIPIPSTWQKRLRKEIRHRENPADWKKGDRHAGFKCVFARHRRVRKSDPAKRPALIFQRAFNSKGAVDKEATAELTHLW
jgi:hypothetical protein